MSTIAFPLHLDLDDDRLHAGFVAILPRIERHARISFRDIRCPNKKEDLVAETIALSWAWYRQLIRKGKDAAKFVSALARYAARAVRSGRRVAGKEKTKDVLSSVAQQRHDFRVESLPASSRTRSANPWDDALQENTQSPIPTQVCFRVDFPRWRLSRTHRDRRLIDELMSGEHTLEVARKHGLSPSRVSQLRRAFHADWERFCGDSANIARTALSAAKEAS